MNIFSQIGNFLASIPFWGWILLTVVIFFFFAVFMGNRDTKKIGRRGCKILKKMDQTYQHFIETKINNSIIEYNSIMMNKEELLTSALTVLKPHIESLISLINATQYEHVEIPCESIYFNNITALCQDLFRESRKNESKRLSPQEEAKIYSGIKDSIMADLITREQHLS
jgi:hypothetical protein